MVGGSADMKILLTGESGYVGSHLLGDLKAVGFEVSTLGFELDDLTLYSTKRNAYELKLSSLDFHSYDVVIHLGAIPDSGCDDPALFYWNYKAVRQIMSRMLSNQHFIFFSSCMADYPVNWYGWSKRCAEDWVNMQSHLRTLIFRPFNIYGGVEPASRLSFPAKLVRGEVRYVFKNFVRDWIHIRNVCSAVLEALDVGLEGNFDLGTGNAVSAEELVNVVGLKDFEYSDPLKALGYVVPSILVARSSRLWYGDQEPLCVKSWCRFVGRR